jgi:type I restriction enzyme S subunit
MKFGSFRNARVVRSSWLEEGGRRLDCNPYMSGRWKRGMRWPR